MPGKLNDIILLGAYCLSISVISVIFTNKEFKKPHNFESYKYYSGDCKRQINSDSMRLKITIGKKSFTARLENNPTVEAFKKQLPMRVDMIELNGNEKYTELPFKLPVMASVPAIIQSGDILLYGNNTIVLFYKTFKTNYSYTRLGKIEEYDGLLKSLGTGNVQVSFDLD